MEIVIASTPESAAVIAADAIVRLTLDHEHPVLGLATGSSPVATYRELISRHINGSVSFSTVKAFLLDEYVGLPTGHPESYRAFIEAELTNHVDLPANALFGPDGAPDKLRGAADDYENLIADAGGIDLQLLGIGSDGHIGFNEPTSSLASRTRLKTLTEETRQDNARFFDNELDAVPRHVLTQGVGTILDARHVILLASGENKARPVATAVEGPIAAMFPASALQLHPHVSIIIDEAAASELTHADYYRSTYANKPDWQQI